MLVNRDGEAFLNPLETRDAVAAAIIRECNAKHHGVPAQGKQALWLDTPMVDMLHGKGTVEKQLPGMLHLYQKFGIDIRKEPILIYPTLHYQNGGICINMHSATKVSGLYAAGEDVGGIHGTNRLMGNSLLDIIVFGRIAGTEAARYSQHASVGSLTLDHVHRFEAARMIKRFAHTDLSPKLLPDYRHRD